MTNLRKSSTTPPAPRPALARIDPLTHGGSDAAGETPIPVRADFSTGVNAFGPAPIVLDALRRADPVAYPDPHCRPARRAVSEWTGRSAEEILIGAGTTELIYAAALAFVRPGDLVLVPQPAFGEYERAARLAGARVCVTPFPTDEKARYEAIETFCRLMMRQRPRMAFLASPESARGALVDRETLGRLAGLCQRVGTLLVLDQAYDAFTRHPLGTPALPGHAAVLHLRSLTKDHALAGVRAGLAIGPASIIDAIARTRPPWSVSSQAQAAVAASCTEKAQRHVRETVSSLLAEAASMADACAGLGWSPTASATHYFLLEVGDGEQVARRLLHEHAVRVRSAGSFGFDGCIRITARRREENALLLAALRQMAAEPARENRHAGSH